MALSSDRALFLGASAVRLRVGTPPGQLPAAAAALPRESIASGALTDFTQSAVRRHERGGPAAPTRTRVQRAIHGVRAARERRRRPVPSGRSHGPTCGQRADAGRYTLLFNGVIMSLFLIFSLKYCRYIRYSCQNATVIYCRFK